MEKLKIEQLRDKKHLKLLAKEYCNLYNNSVLQEQWTIESALELMNYFYQLCQELFLVAYDEEKPVGAIMSGIKPWWDGIHLVDTEVFVSKDYQKNGIASKLYKEHFILAVQKFNVTIMEAHTYQDKNGFPLKWYQELGFDTIDNWKIINGNIKELLKKL